MGLLDKTTRKTLEDLLLRLPNIGNPVTRQLLIQDLPPGLRYAIPLGGAPAQDIRGIVSLLEEDGAQLEAGIWPIVLVIDRAIDVAPEGTRTHVELKKLRGRLSVVPTSGAPREAGDDLAYPSSEDGVPRFLRDDDRVTELEALLFYDDLTIQIGRVPAVIAVLQRLLELAPAVCRLVVDIHGAVQHGTGFRIGPNVLLTNWHVLHRLGDGVRASAVTAEFGYEDDGSGGVLAPVPVPCDPASIVTSRADDWAIIRATEPLCDQWPVVRLSEAVPPTRGGLAYIIQHPGGERKRLGFVRNQVSFFDERVVHYLTDTREGSSGSPVFDAAGKLIALHRAGGRPQEVVGRAPLKKNEGIRISRIIEGLQAQGVAVP